MLKRGAASFLWSAAAWMSYEILWSIAGLPRMLGPVIAASVAMIVVVDPLHLFGPRPGVPLRGRATRSFMPSTLAAPTRADRSEST